MADKRVTIITGAGKGLGAAFAKQIASDGGAVIVNNRIREGQPDSAGDVVAEIVSSGGAAVANRLDVTEPGASEALVRQALDHFGRLDAVIFNAGVNGAAARFGDMPQNEFDNVICINFSAPVALARAAWNALQDSKDGRMLFVSSSAGLYGLKGRAPYAASKGALNAFAATLAHEGRRFGIGVNILSPYARTQMTAGVGPEKLAEMLAPEKVAPLASWLVSTECRSDGENWIAGGGYVRKARVLETEGAELESEVAAWERRHAQMLDAISDVTGFKGAEAAFESLMGRLKP